MRRETTNFVRFLIEDCMPPILQDSRIFHLLARAAWGSHVSRLADFRARAPFLTPGEYESLYREHPRVHEGTDNSVACMGKAAQDLIGTSVCDVGCGTGALLSYFQQNSSRDLSLTGVDFVVDDAADLNGITYVAARVEDLPFPDEHFDTVVCTHVIEHILDYRRAIQELRRITRRRLIIVVPREREHLYTFNPHFNFFPYPHSFLRAMHPVAANHMCIGIGRDIYYREDK